jgi:hypothetical protein
MESLKIARRALENTTARQSDKFARCVELVCVASIGAALALAIGREVMTPPVPIYGVVAVTADGESYIAGEGSDCAAAWQFAIYPENWTSVICQKIN